VTVLHPGVNEIEWLADLKGAAEQIGSDVLGFPVRWSVETNVGHGSRDRTDVRVERQDGSILFTGEAKRPDTPAGVHPLVVSEVNDAVQKAQLQGAGFCFTTNFIQVACLNAGAGLHAQPLLRLQGDLISFIDPSHANQLGWWKALTSPERKAAVEEGLRTVFERYRLSLIGEAPPLSIDSMALDYFQAITDALHAPIGRVFAGSYDRASPSIHHQALEAGLDLDNAQERQYLVAQGIAEVLTAALFHRLLRDYFDSIGPLLGGMAPATSEALKTTIVSGLLEAVTITGDYKPILVISDIAQWVLAQSPDEAMPHWMALFDFVEKLDLHLVSSDILGTIFERLISPERRHELGQHYTQPRLAQAMARWGVRSAETVVLDPACGAGTFLVETYKRHQELGVPHDEALKRNLGNDIDSFAVHLASINLATRRIKKGLNHPLVRQSDAFTLSPGNVNMLHVFAASEQQAEDHPLQKVDLVIANPPYGRSAENELRFLAHLQGHGLTGLPRTTGINLAAWFVLLGVMLAKPDARMAFVLPSGVLQNDNLAPWRAWLRQRYDITVWHTESDVWFSDARVAACVMLFEPRQTSDAELGVLNFVNVLEPVDGDLHWIDDIASPAEKVTIRNLSALPAGADLLIPGTTPAVLDDFMQLERVDAVGQISGVETAAGQKLGHKFFKLEDQHPTATTLVRTVVGLGTELQLNKKFLTPLLGGSKEIDSGEPSLNRFWLLSAPKIRPAANTALGRYVRLGESLEVHLEPSVQARRPWWHLNTKAVNIAASMNEGFRHQIAWFDKPSVVTNNFNTIAAPKSLHAEVVAATLASAFGAIAAQYVSGEVGCEGVRRVLLGHFDRWPAIDPHKATEKALVLEVRHSYQTYRKFKASEFDRLPREEYAALKRLTEAVSALAHGASTPASVAMAESAIACARETVARRRSRETQALGGRTRSVQASGPTLPRRVRTWSQGYDGMNELLRLITSGSTLSKLREHEEIDTPQLFQIDAFDDYPEEERALVDALGPGFEAVFPLGADRTDDLKRTVEMARAAVDDAVTDLLPAAPALDNPGHSTWSEMRTSVVDALRKYMQTEVRRMLS